MTRKPSSKKVEECFEKTPNVIVCVSEGIHDDKGTFICEYDNHVGTDTFGHKMLAGCGKYLENLVRNRLGVKARSVELNVSQRCSSSMMSQADQKEAVMAGEFASALHSKDIQGKWWHTKGHATCLTLSPWDLRM